MKTLSTRHTWARSRLLLVGAVALVGVAGCRDTNNNDQPDAVDTNAVREMGDQAERAVENAAPKIENAAEKVVDTTEDAATTGRVKTALVANKAIDSTKINVDTANNTVTLKGTVANAAQSKLAESIAKREAKGYTVKNQLKVTGNTSPVMKKQPATGKNQ